MCFHFQSEVGTLKVSGYLRCQNLSVNSLVHIPGWGDFQMLQIDAAKDPYTQNQKTRGIAGQVRSLLVLASVLKIKITRTV